MLHCSLSCYLIVSPLEFMVKRITMMLNDDLNKKLFQKEKIARTLIRFYEIFQDRHSPISFTEVCDRYILAHSEIIESEKQLGNRINEIQTEYQDWDEEQFMSKYGTKLNSKFK